MKKITEKECIDRLKREYGNEYELISGYKAFTQKALIRHNTCGHEWLVIPKSLFMHVSSCPVCCGHKKSYKEIKEFLDSMNLCILDATNTDEMLLHEKHIVKCKICGYTWATTLSSLIENLQRNKDRNIGCPKCYNKKFMRLDPSIFEERFAKEAGDNFELLTKYTKSDEKVRIKCKKCGKDFWRYPADVFRYGCPFCENTESNDELDIYEHIKKYYPNVERRNRSILNGKEIDIYIPELKLGIEYDGLYWHSDKKLNKTYHYDKMMLANNNGIRIINIFEDEYNEHKDLLFRKLDHIIGMANEEKIYGRKCVVKEITAKEKNIFLDEFHIQGHDNSTISIGGFYNDELVAVMTFSKSRLGIGSVSDNYELVRYATNSKYNVIGIFGKLLNSFVNTYKPKAVYSFADLRWVDKNDNIYLKNNFIKDIEDKPTYYYFCRGKRYHRFGFRKKEIKDKFPEIYDEHLTEFEMMDKTEYSRIWDCGKIRYIKYF